MPDFDLNLQYVLVISYPNKRTLFLKSLAATAGVRTRATPGVGGGRM